MADTPLPNPPSHPNFCPQCGQKVAPDHQFCPRCGTRLTATTSPAVSASPMPRRSLKQDLEDVRKVGFWVAFFITLPTLTLPALLVNLIAPGDMGMDEAESIWATLTLTAPLTAAVVVVILAIHYEWFSDGWSMTLFGAAILAGTTLLADLLSVGAGVSLREVWQAAGYNPLSFFNVLVVSYYQVYGFWSFASSLVVGSFLAWLWLEKIFPYLKQRP